MAYWWWEERNIFLMHFLLLATGSSVLLPTEELNLTCDNRAKATTRLPPSVMFSCESSLMHGVCSTSALGLVPPGPWAGSLGWAAAACFFWVKFLLTSGGGSLLPAAPGTGSGGKLRLPSLAAAAAGRVLPFSAEPGYGAGVEGSPFVPKGERPRWWRRRRGGGG